MFTITTPEIEELLRDCVAFAEAHGRTAKNELFKNFTHEDIEKAFRFSLLDISFLYHRNALGEIDGILNGTVDRTKKTFYIEHILITDKGLFPYFIRQMENMFKGYTFMAHRYGKIKTYNTEKFLVKLH